MSEQELITTKDDTASSNNASCSAIEGGLRNRSLTLSSVLAIMFAAAHIYFAWYDKTLPIPDFMWAAMFLPYGGVAIGELVKKAKDKTRAKEKAEKDE